jgi:hypothetical protein
MSARSSPSCLADAVRRALAVPRCGAAPSRPSRHARRGGGFRVPSRNAGTGSSRLRARSSRCSTPSRPSGGRFVWRGAWTLVARAGWLVARVLHVRDRGGPRSCSTPA